MWGDLYFPLCLPQQLLLRYSDSCLHVVVREGGLKIKGLSERHSLVSFVFMYFSPPLGGL